MKLKKVLLMLLIAGSQQAHAGEIINASANDVYDAAMEVALDLDAMPSSSNDKLHYFKTDAVTLKPTKNVITIICSIAKAQGLMRLDLWRL